MESLLTSFHIDIRSFSELLHATNAVIAGSAALSALVAGTRLAFEPNDLDIWVHSDFFPPESRADLRVATKSQPCNVCTISQPCDCIMFTVSGSPWRTGCSEVCRNSQVWSHGIVPPDHPGVAVRHGFQYIFQYFMKQHGYVEVDRPVQSDVEYTSNPVFAILRCIQRFQHPSGRSIQVMHCKVPVDDILDTFDLSVAKTWWEPSLHPQHREGFLHCAAMDATKAGLMYLLRDSMTDREKERIKKYEARGFRLVPKEELGLHLLAAVADEAAQ